MKWLAARWNEVWFSPVDARALGTMRMGVGLLLVYWQLTLWHEVILVLSPWGLVDDKMLDVAWTDWGFSVLAWATEPWMVHAWQGAGLAVMVAFTLGWRTRLTGWLSLLVMVSVWHRNPWIHNGGDRLLRISLFYMALSPCGAALSLDALRVGAKTHVPALGLRLLQLQWMIMYTYTGIGKLDGAMWRQGTALYYALSDASYARAPVLMDQLLAHDVVLWVSKAGTWITLVWEVGFVPLVLWRRTRWLTLGLGVLFHLGIAGTMSVAMFSPVAVWGYLAWVDPKSLGGWGERVWTALGLAGPRPPTS